MSVMRRRASAFAAVTVASALVLSGCAASDTGSEETGAACEAVTEVTWLNTIKIEIREQFVAAVDEYNAVNTDCVKISIIDYPQGEPFFSVATPLYEAGNAPVVMTVLQELPDMADRVMDWSGTELAGLAAEGTLDKANINGKQVGIPVTAEAFGLLYNKAVLDELTGGSKDLLADPAFTNWLDTFDLLKEYSIDSASIADTDYDQGVENLGTGEVGFWFMGNWAEPNLLQATPDGSFGVMPVPTSNDAAAYGNDGISVGVPFYIIIDQEQSTQEERDGAMAFISWLLTTPEGQARWSGPIEDNGMNFIPVYNGFTVEPTTYMSQDIAKYIAAGKSLSWINSYYPTGLQDVYGAAAQKYYDGVSDRATFAAELAAAWKN